MKLITIVRANFTLHRIVVSPRNTRKRIICILWALGIAMISINYKIKNDDNKQQLSTGQVENDKNLPRRKKEQKWNENKQ